MSLPELKRVEIEAARYPSLKGRGVLITGGASGIGAELVAAFAGQGCRVAFLDRDAEAGARVACATGATFRAVDLRDIAALQEAVAALGRAVGGFRVLVNNAGNDDRLPLEDLTPEYWDERQAVNMRHQVFAAQAVAPVMAAAGGGSIVNMGSTSWMQKAGGLVAYVTAKAAVEGLTRGLARELGERRIRVNSVAPGWVLTDRQVGRAKAIYPGKFADYLGRQCLKEHLLPPDVARMALWLAADDSRLVTGQTFIVDGGVV
jgi:NAD(P)-dependent dehydrogenase (short-subunit alcohol dehydrogenase family)